MIARITRAKSGISDYLEKGLRKDSQYTRSEKDNVIPIYGNLEIFRQTEQYLNKYKNYKDNYLHITISYSKKDMQLMSNMSDKEKMAMKKDIVMTYIKHHTAGNDMDNEVIAYAEEHEPKIKLDEKGNKRYKHIHLGIALYNPLSDTKLRTTFANNSFIDDTLQAYVNKKYGLSIPRHHKRVRQGINADTKIARDRKYYIEELKNIKSNSELLQYFKDNNIQYREVKTKRNNYYKIINKDIDDVNLKSTGFEHIHKITLDKDFKFSEDKDIKDLKKILDTYYKTQIDKIDKRRSKKTKEALKEIYKTVTIDNDEFSLANATFQQKIFYKHYKQFIDSDLKGYFVDIKDDNNTKFINKRKNINIEDKGDKIVSHSNDTANLKERVTLMLNVAEAKEWNLSNLIINGDDKFKAEAERQIAEILRKRAVAEKEKEELIKQEVEKRPTTVTQQLKREANDKQERYKADKDISLTLLKQTLEAQRVLEYARDKYKINVDDYEIVNNKINILRNKKEKPKNIIDFLQKEIHIQASEAIAICKELYKEQPTTMRVNSPNHQQQQNNKQGDNDVKKRKTTNIKRKRNRELYKSIDRLNERTKQANNPNNMRTLSESKLVSNKNRVKVLLHTNELNKLDSNRRERSDYKMRRASDSDSTVATATGTRPARPTLDKEAIKEAATGAMFLSKDYEEFKNNIKSYLEIDKCEIDNKNETLKIEDFELSFADLDISKEDLEQKFQDNLIAQRKLKKEGLKL